MHCDLDLWLFDLKIYRAHPWLMGSLHVKFHDDTCRCKGKAVMPRKPKCGRTDGRTDRQMDRQTDIGDSSIPPPNFVAGGIKIGAIFRPFFNTHVRNIPYFYLCVRQQHSICSNFSKFRQFENQHNQNSNPCVTKTVTVGFFLSWLFY